MRRFTEENLIEAVVGRMSAEADPRLREVMASLLTHMHAFVREVRLTPEEWMKGIQFLTEVGKWCDDKRQEFILLSDTMGISMLVDAIANPSAGGSTESTVLGPFFRENPPEIADGGDLAPGMSGPRLDVDCRVLSEDGAPIAGARIDCWQASHDGFYDSQMGDGAAHNLRGRLTSGPDGRFRFRTTLPASYPIPHDGPVGELLRALGRHPWRPGHLHFWLHAPGHRGVVTHLFVKGDPYIESDVVFGVKESLIADYADNGAGHRLSYDFKLRRAA